MFDLKKINGVDMMSHIQIAALVGKRNDNVKRTMIDLFEQEVIAFTQIEEMVEIGSGAQQQAIRVNCKRQQPVGVLCGSTLDDDEKDYVGINDAIGVSVSRTLDPQTVIIPEGDLYRLIAKSKLPAAEEFESWVYDEVLVSIRKHGAYMTDNVLEKLLADPQLVVGLATQLQDEKAKRIEAQDMAIDVLSGTVHCNALRASPLND